MMLFGLFLPVLLIVALAYAFGLRPGRMTTDSSLGNRQTPRDVLKERYARGEISREVYEEMRWHLQGK